jgi:ankyrin repeat protein
MILKKTDLHRDVVKHAAGLELFQTACGGDACKTQTLLSASNVQSYINYTDVKGRTPLYKAASQGDTLIVAQLIAAHSNVEFTRLLIEAHCNVDHALKTIGAPKPLHVAAVEGHADVIKQLIAARCYGNVDPQTKIGHTPLHLAAGYGHVAVTKQLIAARCRVDIQDKDGCTPFFIAAQQGHADIVEQLINARCKIDLASTSRLTEKARGHTRIMTMIQKGLNGHNFFGKDTGSYEIDTRLSSRPESPHVDSPFILLGRRLSSPSFPFCECLAVYSKPSVSTMLTHVLFLRVRSSFFG